MKKLIELLIVSTFILFAFVITGCEQPTQPIQNTNYNSLQKTRETRPFRCTLLYSFLSQVNDSVSVWLGTGNSTHFGNCTVIDTATDHYTSNSWTVDGSDWITTANGSIIHMTWFMDYYDPSTWVWEITEGTSHFSGITGGGPYTAEVTSSGDLLVVFTGTITY